MNPSPQAIAAVRSRVTDWAPDDATIAATLNTPDRPNPAPQALLPTPFTVADLMGRVMLPAGDPNAGQPDAAALSRTYGRAAVVRFADDVKVQDRVAVGNWIQLAMISGDVSPAQYAGMLAVLQATELDPSWPAQISWAVATLGRPVDTADIAASRPGA